jgi:hypothetical protein
MVLALFVPSCPLSFREDPTPEAGLPVIIILGIPVNRAFRRMH